MFKIFSKECLDNNNAAKYSWIFLCAKKYSSFPVFLSKNGVFKKIGLRKDLKDDTYNIEIGDLNGDGLLDIIESNSGTLNLYYRTIIKK